jgi:hypothetical protein
MKSLFAIVASVFVLSAFAADIPAKKEEAKPAAATPAKDAKAPAKSEAKTAPAKDAKAAK